MLLRTILFILAILQNALSIKLISLLLEYPITSNKFVRILSVFLCASSQFVLTFSSTSIPPPLRLAILILLMLTRAGGYCLSFGKCNLTMFYLSPLAFVLSSNYSNIIRLVIIKRLPLNILSCLLETVIILLIIIYLSRCVETAVIIRSLRIIPWHLYIVILIFLYLMSFFGFVSLYPEFVNISRLLILPVTIMCVYIVSKVIRISAAELEHKRISDLLVLQFENQVEYYEKINSLYTEFRAFRHDFKNHLICLHTLLDENETEKAITYLNDIELMSHSEKKNYDTGNIIVDSLLDSKSEKAKVHNACIVFNGTAPATGITNVDMCTIFSNALDNAIEACEKSDDTDTKYITIDSEFHQGYYSLRIVNPIFEQLNIQREGKILTTKSDKSLHGFGIANIIKTVKKYDGELKIFTEKDTFILEIELWLKLNEDTVISKQLT